MHHRVRCLTIWGALSLLALGTPGNSQVPGGILPPIGLSTHEDLGVLRATLQALDVPLRSSLLAGSTIEDLKFRRLISSGTSSIYVGGFHCRDGGTSPTFSATGALLAGWHSLAYVHTNGLTPATPPDQLFTARSDRISPLRPSFRIDSIVELDFLHFVIGELEAADPQGGLLSLSKWCGQSTDIQLEQIEVEASSGAVSMRLTFADRSRSILQTHEYLVTAIPMTGGFDQVVVR